jgi:hypothetical protein
MDDDPLEQLRAVLRNETAQVVTAMAIVMADLYELEIEQGRLTRPAAVARIEKLLATHAARPEPALGVALEVLRTMLTLDASAVSRLAPAPDASH